MNNETMIQTKCIAVIGGFDYEGQDFRSLRLFDCQSTAEAYKEELERDYDHVIMEVKEISQESMILS
jgi:hypothetical protein